MSVRELEMVVGIGVIYAIARSRVVVMATKILFLNPRRKKKNIEPLTTFRETPRCVSSRKNLLVSGTLIKTLFISYQKRENMDHDEA